MNFLRRLRKKPVKEPIRSVSYEAFDLRISAMRHSHESALKALAAQQVVAPELEPALLFDAIHNASTGILRDLIARGINMQAVDHTGATALMHAVRRMLTLPCVHILIAAGVDVNQPMRDNDSTALEQALERQLSNVVCVLLHAGAQENQIIQHQLKENAQWAALWENYGDRLLRADYEATIAHERQLLGCLIWSQFRMRLLSLCTTLYSAQVPPAVIVMIADASDARFMWLSAQKKMAVAMLVHRFHRLRKRCSARF